ncbi:hypothetical protein Tco_1238454 [Tanacetum coccineum]
METEAIDNQANLVNYDNENENEIDDLGYQSEEYIEDAHEDNENNHSNGYAKRGITKLCKFRREYGKPGGVKLSVTFDALNRISGKHRALFSSFLRDMVREHIGLQILSWEDWKDNRDKIKEGNLAGRSRHDARPLYLGKEWRGYARGRGVEVECIQRFFDLPTKQTSSDERILLLESQLDAARREREEKELLIKSMSSKMSQTEGMVSPVEIHPINSSVDEEGGTTVVGCDQNDASIQKEMQKRETVKSVGARKTTRSIRKDSSSQDSQSKENVSVLPQAIKCRLWHLKKTTIIAEGTVYKSNGKIMLHNKALPKDCYKVSIDKSLVECAFIFGFCKEKLRLPQLFWMQFRWFCLLMAKDFKFFGSRYYM